MKHLNPVVHAKYMNRLLHQESGWRVCTKRLVCMERAAVYIYIYIIKRRKKKVSEVNQLMIINIQTGYGGMVPEIIRKCRK